MIGQACEIVESETDLILLLLTEFSPRVTLNRIPDRTDSGTESNNLVNSFDEDEFETFNEVQDQNDAGDGDIDNSVASDNPLSVEVETNGGTGTL